MVERKQVALVKCSEYEREEVVGAINRSIDLIGGINQFVSPDQRVLLKPNLLSAAKPEKCVTPHPEVVYAVAKILCDRGCKVVIADSPGAGGTYTESTLRKVYEASGLAAVAKELGVELNYDTSYREMSNPNGKLIKRFPIITPAAEADVVVGVSKAKTHLLTGMTGAVKNMFGVLPGIEKASFHGRMQTLDEFSDMLLDISELVKPRLQVMDAVVAMEGDGPNNGDPKRMNAILASSDSSAIDLVEASLMSFDPLCIGTIRAAQRRGLLPQDLSGVEVLGDRVEDLAVVDFKKPATLSASDRLDQRRIMQTVGRLARAYALRPEVILNECIGCGRCERGCPKKAIKLVNGKAKIADRDCIRCYCCHEMCPQNAIGLRRSLGGRILARASGGKPSNQ